MKAKPILIVFFCLVLGGIGYFTCTVAYPSFMLSRYMSSQMEKGRVVLDGLTPEKLEAWGVRSEAFWAKHGPGDYRMGVYGMGGNPIPPDLEALGVIRIDMAADSMCYLWLGGMDHSSLTVTRDKGNLRFTAEYNDEHHKELGTVPLSNRGQE